MSKIGTMNILKNVSFFCVIQVFAERQRRMEEAAMLERHIMQAQARAMSADERELNRVANTCDTNNYQELGLPPGMFYFF